MLEHDGTAHGEWTEAHNQFRWATDEETVVLNTRMATMTLAFTFEGWVDAYVDNSGETPYVAFYYSVAEPPKWVLPEGDWLVHDPFLLGAACGDWIEAQDVASPEEVLDNMRKFAAGEPQEMFQGEPTGEVKPNGN